MLGVLANSLAVLVGGVIGMLCGSKINSKYTDSLMVALGLATMGMGVVSTVGTADVLCIIVCCSIGTVIGELLHIDDGVNALGRVAERRFAGKTARAASRAPLSAAQYSSASAPCPSWAACRPA